MQTKDEVVASGSKQSFLMLTQGHIDDMVLALTRTFDREGKVCTSIRDALVDVGKHQPNLVLSSIHEHLRNPNVERPHRVLLLATLNLVIDLRMAQIDQNLGEVLVDMCIAEMLGGGGDVIPDWHMAAR